MNFQSPFSKVPLPLVVVCEGHMRSRDGASVLLVSPAQPGVSLRALGAAPGSRGCVPGRLSSDSRSRRLLARGMRTAGRSLGLLYQLYVWASLSFAPDTCLAHYISLRVGLSQCGSLHDR